jgi:hypothetical protein
MLLLSYKTSRRIACIHGAAFIPTEGIQELDTYITSPHRQTLTKQMIMTVFLVSLLSLYH